MDDEQGPLMDMLATSARWLLQAARPQRAWFVRGTAQIAGVFTRTQAHAMNGIDPSICAWPRLAAEDHAAYRARYQATPCASKVVSARPLCSK